MNAMKLLLVVFGPLVFAAAAWVIVTLARRAIAQWRSRLTPEQQEEKREVYRKRLVHPQVEAVEQALGALLPKSLLALYEDRVTIQSGGFVVEKPGKKPGKPGKPEGWPVYCFEPLDAEGLGDTFYEGEFGPGFCFATTGGESWYWVAASQERTKDAPVLFLDYDRGGRHGEKVAESIEEFLSWPRAAMR